MQKAKSDVAAIIPYDTLHYVLVFLRGEPGWHPSLLHFRGTKTVTQLQYYSYRLMVHADDFPHLHHSSRLTQEYVVDCFCKIEEAGLDWCRRNQQQLRAETYQGLMDEIVNNQSFFYRTFDCITTYVCWRRSVYEKTLP